MHVFVYVNEFLFHHGIEVTKDLSFSIIIYFLSFSQCLSAVCNTSCSPMT